MRSSTFLRWLASGLVMASLIGCGGGATEVPKVRYRPSKLPKPEATDEARSLPRIEATATV